MRLVAFQETTSVPLSAGAIAAGAALAAGAAIRGAQVGALDEGPEYIKSGQPESPIDAIGLFAARQACKLYADDPSRLNDRPAASYERVCRPFLDNIGYGTGPSVNLPFRGGQCCGTTYQLTYTFRNPNTGQLQDSVQTFSNVQIVGTFERSNQPNQPTKTGGVRLRSCTDGTIQDVPLGTTFEGASLDQSISNVIRIDGLPDDCGNPVPDFEDPVPPPTPEPPKRPFTFAPNFDIDVEVNVDVDGRISVDIGTGPIVVDPFGDEGGGGDDAAGTPELGPVTPGGNGGFGGDDELGEPPAGKRWVGVAMAITQRPEGFSVIKTQTSDKVYPEVVGNVRLIYNAFGFEVVGTPVQIRSDRVTLWEEVRGANPVAIRVNLEAGFGYQYAGIAQPEDN